MRPNNNMVMKYYQLKKWDGYFLVVFFMSMLNLFYMHYQILNTVGFEFYHAKTTCLDNFLAVLLDVSLIFLLFLLVSWGRVKLSIASSFIVTLLLSFANVLYSRFFGQYLSLSAIGQAENLNDNVVIMSIMSEFRIHDVCYLLFFCFFLLILRFWGKQERGRGWLRFMGMLWTVILLLIIASHSVYWYKGSFERAIQTLFPSRSFCSPYPNWTTFHKGLMRTIIIDNLFSSNRRIVLTDDQRKEIFKEYQKHDERQSAHAVNKDIKNMIFIIVESFMSVTSDLEVDGKEITPCLNRLKRDSNVYYNGHVKSNAKIGKSSDGQLIYMTGLLPLRSEITVSYAKEDSLPGLPKQLLDNGIVKHSQILIPTSPSFWEQLSMNQIYGIRKMYAKYDDADNLDGDDLVDEKMFRFARLLDGRLPESSFSMLLTLSMHEPYDECVEHGFHLNDANLPLRYRNYLTTCHYFDQQIGKYINHLKADGLYDNSLIVIAADHDAHPKFLDMEDKISRDLPLYIINGNIDYSEAWTGDCNQLDVYTTILDVFGIKSDWLGLGHTLLTRDYQNSVTDKTWELSEWIILGDYFRMR